MIQPTISPTTATDSHFERLPTIITFTNKDYIDVAMNWLCAIKKVNLKAQIRIEAIDEDSRDALPDEHTFITRLTRAVLPVLRLLGSRCYERYWRRTTS